MPRGDRASAFPAVAMVLLAGWLPVTPEAARAQAPERPRVVVTTDGEVDDRSSFVRFLLYTTDFDVAGIVATNSIWQKDGHGTGWIHDLIDRYATVRPSLLRHDPRYPHPDSLRAVVVTGNEDRARMHTVGPGHDTPGSDRIVRVLLDADPRPVWLQAWGGTNTIAQALWRIRTSYPGPDGARALSKARVYAIAEQDSTLRWLRDSAGVPVLRSYQFMAINYDHEGHPLSDHAMFSEPWMTEHVKEGHGPLGAAYPQRYFSEGDSPAFFHVIDTGLRGTADPSWGGWGGRFEEAEPGFWVDAADDGDTLKPLWRWLPAIQNDFAARMDWAVHPYAGANHPPRPRIAGPLDRAAVSGERVRLDATASADPDGDPLSFRWWVYDGAGTYQGPVTLGQDGATAWLTAPPVTEPRTVHVILEVRDGGEPALTRYRRVVVTVRPVPATRDPRFDRFRYEGRDPIYDRLEVGADEYVNPILPGFHPDPSVCRSGEDYYLVVSSFGWFPGVPVLHSRNLVDWRLVGHALHRPGQLDLDGHGVSRGIFAPTIRCHGGRLWVITTLVDTGGTLLVTADDPAGPWSDPIRLPEVDGIDPSIFFDDDGRVWITNNGPPPGEPLYDGHRALWIQEYDPTAERTIGPRTLIVNGGVDLSAEPVWIEGPHIFRVRGWYYLIAAEGGTAENHSEVVFRSRSVTGPYEPYEGNPILTQRHLSPDRPHPVTSTGHADFARTPAGDWWAVFLGTRPYRDDLYNTGRETFLLPVDWSGEWPVILERDATVPYVQQRPDLPPGAPEAGTPHPAGNFTLVDEFDGPELPLYWNRIRTPWERWHDLVSDPGWLRIEARPVPLGSGGQPSFLGRRQQHAHARASTAMRYAPERVGDRAGLAAFHDDDHFYLLAVARTAGGLEIRVEGRAGGDTTLVARAPLPAPERHRIRLRIDARGGAYDFLYALDDGPWVPVATDVDGTVLSTRVAGGFVGTFFGLYAYGAPGGVGPAAARRQPDSTGR